MIDKIEIITKIVFKIGILVIGVVFLIIYYWSSQNGRFQKLSGDESYVVVLDTQKGIFYWDDGKGLLSVNVINGESHSYTHKLKK
jgi:hypothetical protein